MLHTAEGDEGKIKAQNDCREAELSDLLKEHNLNMNIDADHFDIPDTVVAALHSFDERTSEGNVPANLVDAIYFLGRSVQDVAMAIREMKR